MLNTITALIIIFIIGAVFGSFACCQAWRLRLKVTDKKPLGSRSRCVHCHKKIAWHDNIPIISWLILRGKCRHCQKPIGKAEIFAEVGLGLAFAGVSYPFFSNLQPAASPTFILSIIIHAVLLLMLVILTILAVYDGKWGELPLFLLTASIICGIIIALLSPWVKINAGVSIWAIILNVLGGAALLAGPFFLIYKLSHERLMGSGDYLLGLAIALAISNWWLSLWVLFLANFIGCLVMLPSTIKTKNHKVYFGPFLVTGFVIVVTFAGFFSSLMIVS